MKGKYLITTNNWFIAPDGNDYKSVWGEVEILPDTILGIKTNSRSSNWYAKVGTKDNHVIIAGCQIHYAIKSEYKPNPGRARGWSSDAANGVKEYDRPCLIYMAD